MSKPINPEEAQKAHKEHILAKAAAIPGVIIEAVNTLIVENTTADESRVEITTDEIVNLVCAKDPSLTSKKIYDEKWLDIEPLYEQNGWIVHYDKPGYSESYGAAFVFSKKD